MRKTSGMERIELQDARERGKPPRDIRSIIIEAVEKGGTLGEGARILGIGIDTLSGWINDHLDGDVRSRVIFPGFTPEPEAAATPEPAEALA